MNQFISIFIAIIVFLPVMGKAEQPEGWFEAFKRQASDEELHQFLFEMPY